MNNKIQRILDELAQGPRTVDQFSIGLSGVYLRSMLKALVELGMVCENPTWPRTYSLVKLEPDEFYPAENADEIKDMFDAMYESDALDNTRVTQHLVSAIHESSPTELVVLKTFMGYASAKIAELLDNLEPISIEEIKIRKA